MQTGSYEAKDGSKRFTTDVVVSGLIVQEIEITN
ncbi:hypothetical protein OQZ33_06655 [Pedobacter sp. MC2016-05]|nr:hypothetical protein [Pedobacter sp. MC2016-05]